MICKNSPKLIKSLSPSLVLFEPNIVIVLYMSFQHPLTFPITEIKTAIRNKPMIK